jgi:hypothetical protein
MPKTVSDAEREDGVKLGPTVWQVLDIGAEHPDARTRPGFREVPAVARHELHQQVAELPRAVSREEHAPLPGIQPNPYVKIAIGLSGHVDDGS